MATSVIKPNNAGIDLPIDLPTTGWSSNQWTYTNGAITDNCVVEVEFKAGTLNDNVPYIEYEKVSGGITFTVPVVPTTTIPVIAHVYFTNNNSIVINQASNIGTSGDAQPLGTNVNTALISLNDKIENRDYFANEFIVGKYNGFTLYRRIFASQTKSVAGSTHTEMLTGLPNFGSIICMSVTIHNVSTNVIETPNMYWRVYYNENKLYLYQTASSGSLNCGIRVDMMYVH